MKWWKEITEEEGLTGEGKGQTEWRRKYRRNNQHQRHFREVGWEPTAMDTSRPNF